MKKRVLCVSIEVLDLSLASRLLRSVAMLEEVYMKLGMQNREGIKRRKKKARDDSYLFFLLAHELALPSLFDL